MNARPTGTGNRFSALASDSEEEKPSPEVQKDSPEFRVWETPATRFPEKSPFTKKKWALQWTQPQFQDDEVHVPRESVEGLSASVWAERIKKSLEKAEQKKDPEFKESVERLSFFRRPV